MKNELVMGRRAFLRGGTLIMASGLLSAAHVLGKQGEIDPVLSIGLVTDIHYADKDPHNNRYYRESIGKLREAVEKFNGGKASFLVELGDLMDTGATVQDEIENVRTVAGILAKFNGDRFYVLGNHCVSALSKKDFLEHCGAKRKETFYSFDRGPFHFVVLDGCFRSDGEPYDRGNFQWTDAEIPAAQRKWLEDDLEATKKQAVVFVHQRLDVDTHYAVKSASMVRSILEKSGKVLAVFQGHSHRNDYREINGIHYCVLRAMVEGSGEANSGYSILNVFADGSLHLAGFRQQSQYTLPRKTGFSGPL